MEKKESAPLKSLVKWIRITVCTFIVLLLFYFGINIRVTVIPEDYTALHPHVLPGEHWVYTRACLSDGSFGCGDIGLFYLQNSEEGPEYHIALFLGAPGQKVEYIPEKKRFRINREEVTLDLKLTGGWNDAACRMITVGEDEFLFIDNNTFPIAYCHP